MYRNSQKQWKYINDLEQRHKEKNRIFNEVIFDGLRHASSKASKHMKNNKLLKKSQKVPWGLIIHLIIRYLETYKTNNQKNNKERGIKLW